jgi:hypothetical protein
MKMMNLAVSAVLAAGLGGCVREARMATPSALAADGERLELSGMGGGTSGSFSLAGASGRFTRSAESVSWPGAKRNRGGGSFELSAGEGQLAGECRFRRGEAVAGPIAVTTRPFAYACDFFRGGRPIDAELVVGEARESAGSRLSKEERRGTLFFEGRRYDLRSVHKDAGGGLATAAPLGYLIEAEGRPVGAVDLNGTNKTLIAPRDPAEREAVIAAGLALSVLWDPAEVDPE